MEGGLLSSATNSGPLDHLGSCLTSSDFSYGTAKLPSGKRWHKGRLCLFVGGPCAPKARIISEGGSHPDNCRSVWKLAGGLAG